MLILVRERNLGGGENVMCLAVIGFSGLNPITARVVMGDLRRNRIGQEACSSAGSGQGIKIYTKRDWRVWNVLQDESFNPLKQKIFRLKQRYLLQGALR